MILIQLIQFIPAESTFKVHIMPEHENSQAVKIFTSVKSSNLHKHEATVERKNLNKWNKEINLTKTQVLHFEVEKSKVESIEFSFIEDEVNIDLQRIYTKTFILHRFCFMQPKLP